MEFSVGLMLIVLGIAILTGVKRRFDASRLMRSAANAAELAGPSSKWD